MNRFKAVGYVLIVALLAGSCMLAMNSVLELPAGSRPRVLFVGGGGDEQWRRTLAGARDAAREFNVDLVVKSPSAHDPIGHQIALMRNTNVADFAGVAFSPEDPESQIKLINELADRTKLVTVNRDCDKSLRLCHIAYCHANSGARAASLLFDELPQPGKVALVATESSDDAQNQAVRERLAGFKEEWKCYEPARSYSTIDATVDFKNAELSAALADPALAMVVAFDNASAEAALTALAKLSRARRVPMIAFDPSEAIFDAIEDGRVSCAILDDPYYNGFSAIERLAGYISADSTSLPVPGHGSHFLVSEVVQKDNLADIRRRFRSRPNTSVPRANVVGIRDLLDQVGG